MACPRYFPWSTWKIFFKLHSGLNSQKPAHIAQPTIKNTLHTIARVHRKYYHSMKLQRTLFLQQNCKTKLFWAKKTHLVSTKLIRCIFPSNVATPWLGWLPSSVATDLSLFIMRRIGDFDNNIAMKKRKLDLSQYNKPLGA